MADPFGFDPKLLRRRFVDGSGAEYQILNVRHTWMVQSVVDGSYMEVDHYTMEDLMQRQDVLRMVGETRRG